MPRVYFTPDATLLFKQTCSIHGTRYTKLIFNTKTYPVQLSQLRKTVFPFRFKIEPFRWKKPKTHNYFPFLLFSDWNTTKTKDREGKRELSGPHSTHGSAVPVFTPINKYRKGPVQFAILELNHSTSKSDQHLISPYNITLESHIEDTRIKGNDHQLK